MIGRRFHSFFTTRRGTFLRGVLVLLVAALAFGHAREACAQGTDQDSDALQHLGRSWTDAWNRHDMSALGALVTEDVEWSTAAGNRLKGRKAFEEDHARRHAMELKEAAVTTTITPVRFLRPDLAVVHVVNRHTGIKRADAASTLSGRGILTWIVSKQDGQWRIAASHATFVPDSPAAR